MDASKLWQFEFAIRRAVNGDKARLCELLRSDYQPSATERAMLADYIEGKLKRAAHRPRSNDPNSLSKTNPLLWMAIEYVNDYKREQEKLHRVKGVEAEAIDKAYMRLAQEHGGAPPGADDAAIERAHDLIAKSYGYRLTTDRIADRLHRSKKRT